MKVFSDWPGFGVEAPTLPETSGEIENFGVFRRRPAVKLAFFQSTAAVTTPRRPAAKSGFEN